MWKLTPKENDKANEFVERTRSENTGVSGGQYTYSFTSTSLGEIAKVTDNCTGEECVLTDFNDW